MNDAKRDSWLCCAEDLIGKRRRAVTVGLALDTAAAENVFDKPQPRLHAFTKGETLERGAGLCLQNALTNFC
jgi:hypothetical protein